MSRIDRFQLPQIVRNDFISGNVLVEGNDLELARSAVSDVFVNHRLRAAKPQPLRPVQVSYKRFDALAVSYFDYGRELEVEPDLFEDFYLVQIPLQGHSTTRCGSTTVDNIVGMASVLPAQRKVAIHMSQDARKLLVQVDRRKVTQKLETYLGHQLTRSPDFNLSAHDVVGLNSPMRHAILGLLSIPFESAGLTQGQRMISSAFEDAFLHSLLFDIESDMSPAIHAGAMSSACPKAVRRGAPLLGTHWTLHQRESLGSCHFRYQTEANEERRLRKLTKSCAAPALALPIRTVLTTGPEWHGASDCSNRQHHEPTD